MRVFIFHLFLTLVVIPSIVWSAPDTKDTMQPKALNSENLNIAPWDAQTKISRFSGYLGVASGNFYDVDNNLTAMSFGLRYIHEISFENNIDYDAQLLPQENMIGIFVGKRFFIESISEMTPYYKISFGTHVKSSDFIAGLLEIKRIQARASFGINNAFRTSEKMYAELGFAYAVVGIKAFALIGTNFDF